MHNPLLESGKPLFFRIKDPASLGLGEPVARMGEAVRVAVRSLGGMQKEALVVSARSGLAWRLASDEGAYLAGLDTAPCPLSFLTTGMVCSSVNELQALAAQRGVVIDSLRLVQDNYYTMTGSALQGSMRGGACDVQLAVQVDSGATRGVLEQLVQDALAASPVQGLLRDALISCFSLSHNGASIAPGIAALAAPALPRPDECFAHAMPAEGDWNDLVQRQGMTPRALHSVTLAGGSLATEQNRLLHVRGICEVRTDGVKEVHALLFNPHGSIFRYLCDEAPADGGLGKAPDALSYAAAGVAFCFMTQFGRYAAITRRDLTDYRIVQEVHFSRGGASGGTGKPGRADPVETHVHLQSGEDDDSARQVLAMAEQTCFLHALCKAQLKTRVSLLDWGQSIPEPHPPRSSGIPTPNGETVNVG